MGTKLKNYMRMKYLLYIMRVVNSRKKELLFRTKYKFINKNIIIGKKITLKSKNSIDRKRDNNISKQNFYWL